MIVRCKKCVLPTTRPDTAFDAEGVCSACRSYEQRPAIDWSARKAELLALLKRHCGRCIVPSSGGKDSTAQVLMLKELGAHVTAVTATTCMLTDIGRLNIENLARYADETVVYTPNMTQRAKLNRLGLEMVGDISWPEHVAIFTAPFRAALDLDIALLFYGENPQNQYGGPEGSDQAREMTRRWVSEFGGLNGLRPSDLVSMAGDMGYYTPPAAENLAASGVEAHFLGQYLPWDSRQNMTLAERAGMRYQVPCEANWWVMENQDNAQTGLHDHMMYRKFGYGRGAAQISVDIRAGRITREAALEWVRQHDGLFPESYMGVPIGDVLDHIGMTEAQLADVLDQFTNWSLFEREADWRPVLREGS